MHVWTKGNNWTFNERVQDNRRVITENNTDNVILEKKVHFSFFILLLSKTSISWVRASATLFILIIEPYSQYRSLYYIGFICIK